MENSLHLPSQDRNKYEKNIYNAAGLAFLYHFSNFRVLISAGMVKYT